MKYWSKLAAGITPYTPGEQPKIMNVVKLNTNENPYPPSPRVLEAVHDEVGRVRLYPNPESSALCNAIAANRAVKSEEVFVGNGSDEVLAFCFQAYFNPEAPIRFADITYSFYEVYAGLFGMQTDIIPLNDDFTMPVEKFFNSSGGVLICNPNAPTSLALPQSAIREILENNPNSVVLVDEAYTDFGAESSIPLVHEFENLVVVKTLSKSHSLAGLRVGYAIGNPQLLEALYRIKNSFNSYPLDRLAQAGAVAAIEDDAYCRSSIAKIVKTRTASIKRLREMGFVCLDSSTNFIFCSHVRVPAAELQKQLRMHGVLVRYFAKPRIDNYLRITVGTDDEMERLFCALENILKENK